VESEGSRRQNPDPMNKNRRRESYAKHNEVS